MPREVCYERFDSQNHREARGNYTSGWLLDTGAWIADHSRLNRARYDASAQKMAVEATATHYKENFEDMFNYAADWLISRAAWLSEQFAGMEQGRDST